MISNTVLRRSTVFLIFILITCIKAFSWGGAHRRITGAAVSCLPQWQKDFLGNEIVALCNDYCYYPDNYWGDRKKSIDPYILEDLKVNTVAMHEDASDEINYRIFSYYLDKSLELLPRPETFTDGIRFTGTFMHMLEDRAAPAHNIPVDNFFEELALFIPSSKGRQIWMHSAMENLDKEYTSGIPGYKPVLLGKNKETIMAELIRRMNIIHQKVAPLILPLAEAVYANNKDRVADLQIIAAKESTKLIADYLFTIISVANNRYEPEAEKSMKVSTDVTIMKVEYNPDEVIPDYRRWFTWGKGYGYIMQNALGSLDKKEKKVFKSELENLQKSYVFLPEKEDFTTTEFEQNSEVGLSVAGFHLPVSPQNDQKMMEKVISLSCEEFKKGNIGKASEYLGIASHIIMDRFTPADVYRQDFFCYRFKFLLPPPEGISIWEKGSFLEFNEPLESKTQFPVILGDSPEEIAFHLRLECWNKAVPAAQQKFVSLIRSLYSNDMKQVNAIRKELAQEASCLVENLIHSVLVLSFPSLEKQGFDNKSVSLTELEELFPERIKTIDPSSFEQNLFDHYWRLRWNNPYCNRLWKNETGMLPTDSAFIRPLKILKSGNAETILSGFIQDSGPEHSFLIPEGVYSEFHAEIGYHPEMDIPEDAEYYFEVLLDGKKAYTSPPVTKGMDALNITVPLGNAKVISLFTYHNKRYKGNLVWGNPVLLKK